jgi:hypothetical protein
MNGKQLKKHTAMKKRIVTIILALFMTIGSSMAQVFIMEDDESLNPRDPNGSITFNVMVNSQDASNDQFVPLGEGILLLSGLAGAYLLRRRKRD